MTQLIVLGCLIALAGVVAGAQYVGYGRQAALDAAYQRGFWDGHETARPRAS